MTEDRRGDDGSEPRGFDWGSPRWRQPDEEQTGEVQAETERGHRYRDDRAPRQDGAIDGEGSVAGDAGGAAHPANPAAAGDSDGAARPGQSAE